MSTSPISREDILKYLDPNEKDRNRAARRDLFYLAFAKISSDTQFFPVQSLQSLASIGGIHGAPFVEYDRIDGLPHTAVTEGVGYCQHGSVLFPTWHRPYLLLIEKAIQRAAHIVADSLPDATQKADCHARADELRLPYWDWMAPNLNHPSNPGYLLPRPLREETTTVNIQYYQPQRSFPNPLLRYRYQQDIEPVDPTQPLSDKTEWQDETSRNDTKTLSRWWTDYYTHVSTAVPQLMLQKDWALFSNHSPAQTLEAAKTRETGVEDHSHDYDSLEGIHDQLHGYVGGSMQNVNYAAFDPLFYFHHCNVDRLLAIWQQHNPIDSNNPMSWIQSSPTTAGTFSIVSGKHVDTTTPLAPFRMHIMTDGSAQQQSITNGSAAASRRFFTSNDCKDVRDLHYTYPDLETHPHHFTKDLVQMNTATLASRAFQRWLGADANSTGNVNGAAAAAPSHTSTINDVHAAAPPTTSATTVPSPATASAPVTAPPAAGPTATTTTTSNGGHPSMGERLLEAFHISSPHPQTATAGANPHPTATAHAAVAAAAPMSHAAAPAVVSSARVSNVSTTTPSVAQPAVSTHSAPRNMSTVTNVTASSASSSASETGVPTGALRADGITISAPLSTDYGSAAAPVNGHYAATTTYNPQSTGPVSTGYGSTAAPTAYNVQPNSTTIGYGAESVPAHPPTVYVPSTPTAYGATAIVSPSATDNVPVTARAWLVQFTHLPKMYFGGSYFVRVFVNLPDADESTPIECDQYAGQVFVFARGNEVTCSNCQQHSQVRLSLNITQTLVELGLVDLHSHKLRSDDVHVKAILAGHHVEALRGDAHKDDQLNNDVVQFEAVVKQLSSYDALTSVMGSPHPIAHHQEHRFSLHHRLRPLLRSTGHEQLPSPSSAASGPFHFTVAAQRHPSRMRDTHCNLQPTRPPAVAVAVAH